MEATSVTTAPSHNRNCHSHQHSGPGGFKGPSQQLQHSTMEHNSSHSTNLQTLETLKTIQFDAWKCDTNEMLRLIEEMYKELGLIQALQIPADSLKRFLVTVRNHYRENPFHNFRHCFCVTQMMYVFIHQCQLKDKFSLSELAALITACICHDLDHPGLNNTYQINARTELAVRYKDESPLENHHWAVTHSILNQRECDIFLNLSPTEREAVHKDIALLILATDMSKHERILKEFKEKKCSNWDTAEDKGCLKMILIKACDVSNEIRPPEISEPWVEKLLEEYFQQSEIEKRNGLPLAPFMDRERVTKSSSQIGFIRFVLLPLYEAINQVLPQMETLALGNLNIALGYYEDLKAKET